MVLGMAAFRCPEKRSDNCSEHGPRRLLRRSQRLPQVYWRRVDTTRSRVRVGVTRVFGLRGCSATMPRNVLASCVTTQANCLAKSGSALSPLFLIFSPAHIGVLECVPSQQEVPGIGVCAMYRPSAHAEYVHRRRARAHRRVRGRRGFAKHPDIGVRVMSRAWRVLRRTPLWSAAVTS